MTILMTGATGFVGSRLLEQLLNSEHRIIILKRSASDRWRINQFLSQIQFVDIDLMDVEEIFKKEPIDVIVHMATDYGRSKSAHMLTLLWPNVQFPLKLLDLGIRYGTSAFINADTSTDSKYSLYSATKKCFLELAKSYTFNSRIKFINMLLGYVYGEKDANSKFIPLLIESILNGTEIKATQGDQKRDFIYVGDVVESYLRVIDRMDQVQDKFTEIGIGTGRLVSLKEFAGLVELIAARKMKVLWGALPYRPNEIFDGTIDSSLARQLLEWQPQTSLEQGIRTVVDWYKQSAIGGAGAAHLSQL